MKDYNIKDYRKERWNGFKDYFIKMVYAGDCDPSYPMMKYICKRLKLDEEQRYWLAFLYGTNYCVPTSYYILNEFPNFENINIKKMEEWWINNKKKTLFQTDRKKVKNFDYFVKCVESYRNLVGKNQSDGFERFFYIKNKKERYKVVYNFTNKIFYFGRFSLFNYLETISELTNLKMEPHELDFRYAESARNGMCYACNKDKFITLHHKKPKEKIDYKLLQNELDRMIKELKEENKEIDVNYWNIETALCGYKKLFWNTRYLGYYLDRGMQEIITLQENVKNVDWNILWDFREKYIDEFFLGEKRGWKGIRDKNLTHLTQYGVLDMDMVTESKNYIKKSNLMYYMARNTKISPEFKKYQKRKELSNLDVI